MTGVTEIQIIRDAAQAAAMLQPIRVRMLKALREPQTAAGLARGFALPRQQVNYHLRELEKEGFIELVEERRKGNCMERVVRSAARSFVISPEALGELGPDQVTLQDRFSAAYLVAAAVRIVRDIAVVCYRARAAGKRVATMTMETEVKFRNPEERSAFGEELAEALASLTAKYHAAGATEGRTFRFVVGGYPAITKPDGVAEAGPAAPVKII